MITLGMNFFFKVWCVQSHTFIAWYCTCNTKEFTVYCTNGSQHVKSRAPSLQCRFKKKKNTSLRCITKFIHYTANMITEETAACFLSLSESMPGDLGVKRTHTQCNRYAGTSGEHVQLAVHSLFWFISNGTNFGRHKYFLLPRAVHIIEILLYSTPVCTLCKTWAVQTDNWQATTIDNVAGEM